MLCNNYGKINTEELHLLKRLFRSNKAKVLDNLAV